jgi:truncated hemoglobin YjbI
MDNKESAHVFIEAIREIASKVDNLNNLESYLAHHFDKWIEKFANTPENIAAEMKSFAEMEI